MSRSTGPAFRGVIADSLYGARWHVYAGGERFDAAVAWAKVIGEEEPTRNAFDDPDAEDKLIPGVFLYSDRHHGGMFWFESTSVDASVVAHECFHATAQLMRKVGVRPLCRENEEAFAYMLQALVMEVLGALADRKRGK